MSICMVKSVSSRGQYPIPYSMAQVNADTIVAATTATRVRALGKAPLPAPFVPVVVPLPVLLPAVPDGLLASAVAVTSPVEVPEMVAARRGSDEKAFRYPISKNASA